MEHPKLIVVHVLRVLSALLGHLSLFFVPRDTTVLLPPLPLLAPLELTILRAVERMWMLVSHVLQVICAIVKVYRITAPCRAHQAISAWRTRPIQNRVLLAVIGTLTMEPSKVIASRALLDDSVLEVPVFTTPAPQADTAMLALLTALYAPKDITAMLMSPPQRFALSRTIVPWVQAILSHASEELIVLLAAPTQISAPWDTRPQLQRTCLSLMFPLLWVTCESLTLLVRHVPLDIMVPTPVDSCALWAPLDMYSWERQHQPPQ